MFEGKASTWYFSLTAGSITSWNEFDIAFINKFGDDKSPAVLVSELSKIRIEPKEKVKDFNQRFLTLRNRIPATSRPTEDVTIEFYTSALPGKIAMFVRQKAKLTLAENFEEAIKVEKDVSATKENSGVDTDSTSSSRKKTDSPAKTTTGSDKRSQDALDLDSLQRVIKKLSNEIIDLKKGTSDNTPNKEPPRQLFRRPFQNPAAKQNTPSKANSIEEINSFLKSIVSDLETTTETETQSSGQSSQDKQDTNDNSDNKPPNVISHFCDTSELTDDKEVAVVNVNQHQYNTRSKKD